jgi:serine/threonine protein kinase
VWAAWGWFGKRTTTVSTGSSRLNFQGSNSQSFSREAKAIAALNHPNICTIYDVGPDYLVMEYVDGSRLEGPLPMAKVLEYAVQMAQALGGAHRKGFIYRDLKPANVLVTGSRVKLLDFGLAKRFDERPDYRTAERSRFRPKQASS